MPKGANYIWLSNNNLFNINFEFLKFQKFSNSARMTIPTLSGCWNETSWVLNSTTPHYWEGIVVRVNSIPGTSWDALNEEDVQDCDKLKNIHKQLQMQRCHKSILRSGIKNLEVSKFLEWVCCRKSYRRAVLKTGQDKRGKTLHQRTQITKNL